MVTKRYSTLLNYVGHSSKLSNLKVGCGRPQICSQANPSEELDGPLASEMEAILWDRAL